MEITETKKGNYALEDGSIVVIFDEIESSGYGYWSLGLDGREVARVTSITDLRGDDRKKWRKIKRDTR